MCKSLNDPRTPACMASLGAHAGSWPILVACQGNGDGYWLISDNHWELWMIYERFMDIMDYVWELWMIMDDYGGFLRIIDDYGWLWIIVDENHRDNYGGYYCISL
jgi:hypothetical protein